jgi:type IV pilus assembly protein PilE
MLDPSHRTALRRREPLPSRPANGITLVELMVVLAIAAILTAMAWPSFQDSVKKGRRSDAMAALAQVMQAQERWRSNNVTYQDSVTGLGQATTSPKGYYGLSVVAGTADATGYRLQAALVSGTAQATDTVCSSFFVEMRNGGISYTSAGGGGSANGTPDPCWVK